MNESEGLALDVSVVFPCLNEVQAVRLCIDGAYKAIADLQLSGEVIVCNNGSRDGSAAVARATGAVVVDEPSRGYGTACRSGLKAARGRILVLVDCDGSYQLDDLGRLILPIQNKQADVVLGSRFLGEMQPGSMPILNRWIGNPLLTSAGRYVSKVPTTDGQSGMRALSRRIYEDLTFRTVGPEFTHEFLIQIGRRDVRIAEVSVRYYPRIGRTKLRRWRAATRQMRFLVETTLWQLNYNGSPKPG